MFGRTGSAAHKMPDTSEIKVTTHFPVDHFANQGRLGPFLGEGAPAECCALGLGKADRKGGFHDSTIGDCKTNCKTENAQRFAVLGSRFFG